MTQNSSDFPVGVHFYVLNYFLHMFFLCVCVKESKEVPHPAKQMCTAHRFLAPTMDLVFAGQDLKGLIKIQNIALVTHSLLDSVSSLRSSLQSYNMKVFCHCLVSHPREICHGAV